MNYPVLITTVALLASFPTATLVAQEKQSQDFEARLKKLETLFEEQRVENHIPGLALAVVKDDKIVFAKGFGLRDVEGRKPVETRTGFAIGSSTKSFTAAIVAMLVDDGKLDWDDPVSKYIPTFKLDVKTDGEEVTIRDLLCHRTGFTRMGLLWAGGNQSRAEVLASAANAKPYGKFRKDFLYNNVMYMAAGYGAGKAGASDWDTLIAERIFKPLGMKNSNTTVSAAKNDPQMSLGYEWDKDKKEFERKPMRDLDSIAPAGAINSNVLDMAQWIRFQLAKGKFDDKQLLSEEQHAETWKKQIAMGGGADYGFGWMLRRWQGEKVVEHGGNIDGFGAQVSLLPKHNAGYVLLTNVTATPLQGGSVSLVFDTLFGEEKEDGSDAADVDMDGLPGTYIANFGPFNGAKFEVKMKDDKLAVDVPGQMLFELKPPNKDGKWYFALTDTIAVSFNKQDDKVVSMKFYQSGMEPEFLREDYEPKPESPLDVTAPIVGRYQDPDDKTEVTIKVSQGRVIANAGKRGVFSLLPPDKDGMWHLRAQPGLIYFQFNKNDDGTVKSMTRFQGDKKVEMARVNAEDIKEVPSVEKLLAKMRENTGALDGTFAACRLTGTVQFVHQGISGSIETIFAADGKHAARQDFGKVASIVEVYDGERGFTDTSLAPFEEVNGAELALLKLRHPAWTVLDWSKEYTDVSIVGETTIDDTRTFIVRMSGEDVSERRIFISEQTGLVVREVMQIPIHNVGTLSVEISYADFRKAGGAMVPFKSISKNVAMGTAVTQYEKVEDLKSVPDGAFVVKSNDEK